MLPKRPSGILVSAERHNLFFDDCLLTPPVLKEIESDDVTRNFRRQERKAAEAANTPSARAETSQQKAPSGPTNTKIASTDNFY